MVNLINYRIYNHDESVDIDYHCSLCKEDFMCVKFISGEAWKFTGCKH